ncbi:MAG: PIG-L family deacetylase [Verrucomicrobiota bacterium]
MQLANANSHLHIPPSSVAIKPEQVTHLAIGAHSDDLEIFAYHGIAECYDSNEKHFAGVTITEGRGCSRNGTSAHYTNDEMAAVRAKEQKAAADLGRYAFVALLGYQSSDAREKAASLIEDLANLLEATQPEILYLHNPADKHSTHIACLSCCVTALRRLPVEKRPKKIYGCEVWRDLDWMLDSHKIALPVDRHPELAAELISVFDSQIQGGKRYDLATLGRRRANATFFEPRSGDEAEALTYAIDLSPLAKDDQTSLSDIVAPLLSAFTQDVQAKLEADA